MEIRPTPSFIIRNSDAEPLVQFTSSGDVVLYTGEFTEQSNISPDGNTPEFIIKTGASGYRALVDETDGDMEISGLLYEEVSGTLSPPDDSFIIKDGSGTVKAFINADSYTDQNLDPSNVPAGSLVLCGELTELDN